MRMLDVGVLVFGKSKATNRRSVLRARCGYPGNGCVSFVNGWLESRGVSRAHTYGHRVRTFG